MITGLHLTTWMTDFNSGWKKEAKIVNIGHICKECFRNYVMLDLVTLTEAVKIKTKPV